MYPWFLSRNKKHVKVPIPDEYLSMPGAAYLVAGLTPRQLDMAMLLHNPSVMAAHAPLDEKNFGILAPHYHRKMIENPNIPLQLKVERGWKSQYFLLDPGLSTYTGLLKQLKQGDVSSFVALRSPFFTPEELAARGFVQPKKDNSITLMGLIVELLS